MYLIRHLIEVQETIKLSYILSYSDFLRGKKVIIEVNEIRGLILLNLKCVYRILKKIREKILTRNK